MSGPKYSYFDCDLNMVLKAYTANSLAALQESVHENYSKLRKQQDFLYSAKGEFNLKMQELMKTIQEQMEKYPQDLRVDNKINKIIDNKIKQYIKKLGEYLELPNSFNDNYNDLFQRKFSDFNDFNEIKAIVDTKVKTFDKLYESYRQQMFKVLENFQNDIDNTFSKEIKKKKVQLQKQALEEFSKMEGFDYEVKQLFLLLSKEEINQLSQEEIDRTEEKLNDIERYINFKHADEKDIKAMSKLYDKISAFFMNQEIAVKDKVEFIENEYQTFLYLSTKIDEIDSQYQEAFAKLESIKKLFGIDYTKYGDISSLSNINEVLNTISKDLDENYKEKYISDSIKEVMDDFGYHMIDSDVVSKEQTLFDYDGESALSLYRSKEGMVMLELVATGDESEMSDNDKTMFLNKMEHFCSKYPKILDALRAKGITIKTRGEMPVAKEFVRKVATQKGTKRKAAAALKQKRLDE